MIINKAGSLIYQKDFAEGLNKLSSNDYLILAGTFHGYIPLLSFPLPPSNPSNFSQCPRNNNPPVPSLLPAHQLPRTQHLTLLKSQSRRPCRPTLRHRSPRDGELPPTMLLHAYRDEVPVVYGTPAAKCGCHAEEDI